MPKAGRLGDTSYVRSDSHGCSRCAHSAVGPSVVGSSNVTINDRPALRVGDTGVHSTCCGDNQWKAAHGAPRVLVNGRPAHRIGDTDEHCGGIGHLLTGSPNVLIGNYVSDYDAKRFTPHVVLKDMPGPMGLPLIHTPWALLEGWRVLEEGETDEEGRAHIKTEMRSGIFYELRYPGRTIFLVGAADASLESIKGLQLRLACLGYHPGPVRGRLDARTRGALRDFQVDHGIKPDGVYTLAMQAKIREVAGF